MNIFHVIYQDKFQSHSEVSLLFFVHKSFWVSLLIGEIKTLSNKKQGKKNVLLELLHRKRYILVTSFLRTCP